MLHEYRLTVMTSIVIMIIFMTINIMISIMITLVIMSNLLWWAKPMWCNRCLDDTTGSGLDAERARWKTRFAES